MSKENSCPLCATITETSLVVQGRTFFSCPTCTHWWLSPHHYLTSEEEGERYRLHQNSAQDQSYVTYLSKIVEEVKTAVSPALFTHGVIDYGSCHEAVLSKILESQGVRAIPYDPYFGLTVSASMLPVGVIVASESAEHFHTPVQEFTQMLSWLVPRGELFLKSALTDSVTDFSTWWYKNDPTHVQFYSKKSLTLLGEMVGFVVLFAEGNSIHLRAR